MQDRVPAYPGRVRLLPVEGEPGVYDLVMADQPTQAGTPLTKGNLLSDQTAALFGLDSEATPDDALAWIGSYAAAAPKVECGSYMGTGTYGESGYNSLSFGFAPKVLMILGYQSTLSSATTHVGPFLSADADDQYSTMCCFALGTEYTKGAGLGRLLNFPPWGKRSADGCTVYWYNEESSHYQYNNSNATYYYMAIG